MTERTVEADLIVVGNAAGPALILEEPLSLWGGLDATTGRITDVRHPQHDTCVSQKIVVMASGRGSSSASSVLVEAVRLGTAPAGFILGQSDEILALGALVANELYQHDLPIGVLDLADHQQITAGDHITISNTGALTIGSP